MRVTLHQCGQARHLQGVPAGQYDLEYTDSTHLHPTEWVRLVTLDVRPTIIPLEDNNTEQFYTLTKAIGGLPGKTRASGGGTASEKSDPVVEHNRRIRTIEDTLALALGRIARGRGHRAGHKRTAQRRRPLAPARPPPAFGVADACCSVHDDDSDTRRDGEGAREQV